VAAASTGMAELSKRYAFALFSLADEQKALDDVARDFNELRTMITESEDLRRLLNAPTLGSDVQKPAINALADKAGWHKLTRNFLNVAVANRRLMQLPVMIEGFLDELARRRGEVKAKVTVAQALTDQQITDLTASIQKVVGGSVSLDIWIDPSLLGGMIVMVGSRMIDSSLRSKLQRLQFAMKGIG